MATDLMTGPRLREMRRRRGWTQRHLAAELGVDVSAVRNWERGRRPVSAAMAKLIRFTFNTKAQEAHHGA